MRRIQGVHKLDIILRRIEDSSICHKRKSTDLDWPTSLISGGGWSNETSHLLILSSTQVTRFNLVQACITTGTVMETYVTTRYTGANVRDNETQWCKCTWQRGSLV